MIELIGDKCNNCYTPISSRHANGVEDSGLVVDDSCWNEVSGQVIEECFGAMDGTVSKFIEVTRL